MVGTQQATEAAPRCTLCPAGCGVSVLRPGPDQLRVEPAGADGPGICPRGMALGELLADRRRIVSAAAGPDRRPLSLDAAASAVADALADRRAVFFLDGSLPHEQLAAAVAATDALPDARLCLVVEPAEEQLLMGTEACGAEYLADADLAGCDGVLIVGDAFAANPAASRYVFEARAAGRRMPLVVIDPAGGTSGKFATAPVAVGPGEELAALAAVARSVGADAPQVQAPDFDPAGAEAAGHALAGCQRLGVLLTAEYGRGTPWRQIGWLAGRIATKLGGGLAVQTAGANALGAVRMSASAELCSLAEALATDPGGWVVLGCDLLGMLGWTDLRVLAAAAAMPNATTDAAEVVLPAALAEEVGGTLVTGGGCVEAAALMPPPAGVAAPADVLASIVSAGGSPPAGPAPAEPPGRVDAGEPPEPEPAVDPAPPVLLYARRAAHAGCGALTARASWQAAREPVPELHLSPATAEKLGLEDRAAADVRAGQRSLRVSLRIERGAADGVAVLPEGLCAARELSPCEVDPERNVLAAPLRSVRIEAAP